MLSVVLIRNRIYDITDSSSVQSHLQATREALLFISVPQYPRDVSSLLDVQRLDLGLRLHGHDFYMVEGGTVRLTTPRHGFVNGFIGVDV